MSGLDRAAAWFVTVISLVSLGGSLYTGEWTLAAWQFSTAAWAGTWAARP